VDAPCGNFTRRDRQRDAIALFAGGIGIAPVLSILRQLAHGKDSRSIGLVYGARSARHLVCAEEINAMAAGIDLCCEFFVDGRTPDWPGVIGEPGEDALRGALRAEPSQCLRFVCGPAGMIEATLRQLRASGVPTGQIVSERFDYA